MRWACGRVGAWVRSMECVRACMHACMHGSCLGWVHTCCEHATTPCVRACVHACIRCSARMFGLASGEGRGHTAHACRQGAHTHRSYVGSGYLFSSSVQILCAGFGGRLIAGSWAPESQASAPTPTISLSCNVCPLTHTRHAPTRRPRRATQRAHPLRAARLQPPHPAQAAAAAPPPAPAARASGAPLRAGAAAAAGGRAAAAGLLPQLGPPSRCVCGARVGVWGLWGCVFVCEHACALAGAGRDKCAHVRMRAFMHARLHACRCSLPPPHCARLCMPAARNRPPCSVACMSGGSVLQASMQQPPAAPDCHIPAKCTTDGCTRGLTGDTSLGSSSSSSSSSNNNLPSQTRARRQALGLPHAEHPSQTRARRQALHPRD